MFKKRSLSDFYIHKVAFKTLPFIDDEAFLQLSPNRKLILLEKLKLIELEFFLKNIENMK